MENSDAPGSREPPLWARITGIAGLAVIRNEVAWASPLWVTVE